MKRFNNTKQDIIMKELLISTILLLTIIGLSNIASATTYNLYTCQSLTAGTPVNPNTYVLQNDLTKTGNYVWSTCLELLNNTILDLNGYNIWDLTTGETGYYHAGIIIGGDNITIKNGYVYSIWPGYDYKTVSTAIWSQAPTFNNIEIDNVTAGASSYGVYSNSSYGIDCRGNITIKDSIFFIGNYGGCAGIFIDGNLGLITNSTFQAYAAEGCDIGISSNNFDISACFNSSRITNSGNNNTFNQTCVPVLIPLTNVNLTILPKYADYSDQYIFYANITGGYTPFNVSWYIDGYLIAFNNIQYSNYFTSGNSGLGIGNHTAYIVAKDSIGTVKTSNIDWFFTNATGMINNPILTITPSSGNVFTTFNFSTMSIFNGSAPYSVQIKALEVGGHIIATCSNILENGTCNGTFRGNDLFNSGNIPITGIIFDNMGNIAQTTTTTISFTKETEGNPLMIYFGVNPTTNGTTDDLYRISLNFTGSKPPFNVEFRDTNGLICSYLNTYTTKFNLYLRFYSGDHYLNGIVYGSDGQINMSNFGNADKLYFDISQAGNIFQLKNRVINCGGVLGDSNNNEVYTGTDAEDYGGVSSTPVNDQPFCLLGICLNASLIGIVLIVGIGIYAEMKAKSGGVAFVGVLIIGLIVLAYMKIIPMWIAIIGGILIALVFAYLGRKMIKGG